MECLHFAKMRHVCSASTVNINAWYSRLIPCTGTVHRKIDVTTSLLTRTDRLSKHATLTLNTQTVGVILHYYEYHYS